MPTYRVNFRDGRVGSTGGHQPLVLAGDDLGDLAAVIRNVVRPHLLSAHVQVAIHQSDDDPRPVGFVFAGFRTVAAFTVKEVSAPARTVS